MSQRFTISRHIDGQLLFAYSAGFKHRSHAGIVWRTGANTATRWDAVDRDWILSHWPGSMIWAEYWETDGMTVTYSITWLTNGGPLTDESLTFGAMLVKSRALKQCGYDYSIKATVH